jgi:hypothetical protein
MVQGMAVAGHVAGFGGQGHQNTQLLQHRLRPRSKTQMHRKCNELSRSMEHTRRSGDNAAPFLIDRRAFAPALLHD